MFTGGSWPDGCYVVSYHSGVDWLHGGVENCDSLLSVLALLGGEGGWEALGHAHLFLGAIAPL